MLLCFAALDFHKEAKELDNSNITGSGHDAVDLYLLIMRVSWIISKNNITGLAPG